MQKMTKIWSKPLGKNVQMQIVKSCLLKKPHFHLWGDLKEKKSQAVVRGTMLRERAQIELDWRFSAKSGKVAEQEATMGVFLTFWLSCFSSQWKQWGKRQLPSAPQHTLSHMNTCWWRPEKTGTAARFDPQGLTSRRASRSSSSWRVQLRAGPAYNQDKLTLYHWDE